MSKKVILGSLVLVGMMGLVIGFYNLSCFAQEEGETITVTTYYLSPYGIYKELRTKKMAIGDNYSDSSQYYWEDTFPNIDSEADLIVEGNVGIGTTDPRKELNVKGDIHATGDICTDKKCLNSVGGGDTYVKGGLYGYCSEYHGYYHSKYCAEAFEPAFCGVCVCRCPEVF